MQRPHSVFYPAIVLVATAMLSACSSMQPDPQWTISKTRPTFIVPMLVLAPGYPLAAWDNNALPSSVTACFKVDRNGRAQDVTITRISIPDSGDEKLSHRIRVALGADVRKSVKDNRFWPVKVHGKRVESPRVCQDYRFTRKQP